MKNLRNRTPKEIADWFKVLLAVITLLLLITIYIFAPILPDSKVGQLILNTIPSLVAVLLSVPVIYFAFTRAGIEDSSNINNDFLLEIEAIKQDINEIKLSIQGNNSRLEAVNDFYETFTECSWCDWINSSQKSVDIVVYYFDTWIKNYRNDILIFFQRPNTRMRVFVSDPEIEDNLKLILRLFPENNSEVIKDKVYKTYRRLSKIIEEAGINKSRLEFYLCSIPLNYSVQVFDEKKMVISLFEMNPVGLVKSPAIVVDLNKSEKLKEFWQKEINGLVSLSRKYEDN